MTDLRYRQWRRQRSKGARSFQGQNILQPGHSDAPFFLKKVDDLFSRRLKTQSLSTPLRLFHCQNKTKRSAIRYGEIFILQ